MFNFFLQRGAAADGEHVAEEIHGHLLPLPLRSTAERIPVKRRARVRDVILTTASACFLLMLVYGRFPGRMDLNIFGAKLVEGPSNSEKSSGDSKRQNADSVPPRRKLISDNSAVPTAQPTLQPSNRPMYTVSSAHSKTLACDSPSIMWLLSGK